MNLKQCHNNMINYIKLNKHVKEPKIKKNRRATVFMLNYLENMYYIAMVINNVF